ncbi:MAG: cytochrome c oxidase subunit II [Terriglobales bacterium]
MAELEIRDGSGWVFLEIAMQTDSSVLRDSVLAQPISHLFLLVGIVMAAILLLVTVLVLYASIRYRHSVANELPRQEFGRTWLEILWTAGPIVILVFIFAATIQAMKDSDPGFDPNRQPDLVIVAHQWWWEARYTDTHVIAANEIHVPVGKRLFVRLESADVIHDWWVPQLGRKMDAIPGHPNFLWIEADSPGLYSGTCAEYCGAEHAWMRIGVIAEAEPAFEQWSRHQLEEPSQPPPGGDAARGDELFQQMTCGNCHTIAGTLAQGKIGPDLTHVGGRSTLAAGRFRNTPANLARWLADPQAIKPGSHMPNFQLTDSQVQQLTSYLETLQ